MIEVRVERIVVHNNVELIVLLRGDGDARVLPIQVDQGQAYAIGLMLEDQAFPRPLTHDLMKTVIEELGGRLVRAEISSLVEGTFRAKLVLLRSGNELMVDSRPSDAIALALRCEAPILVNDDVMNEAGVMVPVEPDAERKPVKKHSPVELLEQKLAKAIQSERYEDAAALRDELKRLRENKTSN
ncbi:MAG: bifunctional nuclease family protein [bacterium]